MSSQYGFDGFDDDQQVKRQRIMADVVKVVAELDSGFFFCGCVALHDLCPASDAGPNQVPIGVAGDADGEFIDEGVLFRAWADQAHVAHDHVGQLGDFVQAAFAQEVAQSCDAFVVGLRELGGSIFLLDHGAEFPDAKGPTMQTGAHLTVEGGALGVQFDGDGHQHAQGNPGGGQSDNDDEVDQALEAVVGGVAVGLPQGVTQGKRAFATRQ